MILTYYHAIELMSSLPVLLAHADNKRIQETTITSVTKKEEETDNTSVVEMWRYTSSAMEVNGADFY